MKHVLVTGSAGQLGLKLQELAKESKDIKFSFFDIEDFDITNYSNVDNFLSNSAIDIIINCAAYTAVDLAEEEKEKAYSVNTLAPKNIAIVAAKNNIKIIHISTDYVFDGTKNTPYSENDITNPVSVYGKTKLDGENEIFNHNKESVVIRTSWLYSEYGKNFAKTILRIAKEKEFLKVVYDQVGTPTYAGDLARCILNIVEQYINNGFWKSGIYHFSNLGVCSWYDFAIKILKFAGLDLKVFPVLSNEFPSVAKRPNYSVFNKSKVIDTYKLTIPYWEDSCEIMIKNYIKKGTL